MSDPVPVTTERLIKRMRRLARKWQGLAPRQSRELVTVEAVHVRALCNLLWQAAGRLDDYDTITRVLAAEKQRGKKR